MGLGLGLCTIEGLLEIVHQVLDIFKPELIDAASNTAVRMPSRPSMRFRPKLAESCVKSGPGSDAILVVSWLTGADDACLE